MHPSLLELLRCPETGDELTLLPFRGTDGPSPNSPPASREDVGEGLLIGNRSGRAYAIHQGVPIMLRDGYPAAYLASYGDRLREHVPADQLIPSPGGRRWSFSTQWDEHAALEVETTWGYTSAERLEQLLLETDRPREWFAGKTLLDAGCGNGRLTDRATELDVTAVGIDYSESVFRAQRERRSPRVHFVRGDLMRPPFAEQSFDVVLSNGVLHHTPETRRAFMPVARTVKTDGVFYLWLYRKPETFFRRYVYYGFVDSARFLLSRSPDVVARAGARVAALAALASYRLRGRAGSETYRELVIGMLDTLTPRWRHYHTPIEVARWFFDAGFSPPTLTHWDNRYGFGVVATRRPQPATPGDRLEPSRRPAAQLSRA